MKEASGLTFEVELVLLKELLVVLKRLQTSLVTQNIDDVEDCLQVKQELLKKLSDASKERHKILFKLGFESSEKGMVNWLDSNKKSHLVDQWLSMQRVLTEVKEVTRLNAMMVNKFISRNQQTLDKVMQFRNQNTAQMYGPDGLKAGSKISPMGV